MGGVESLFKDIKTVKCEKLVKQREENYLITISPDHTVKYCLELMESRSIHSLPVVVEEGFVGVIDYLAILKLYNHQKRVASVTWLDFLNKSLDALGFEDSCLTHTPSIETTLKEALDQLGKATHYRLYLSDPVTGNISHVVTQRDMLKFLYKNRKVLGGLSKYFTQFHEENCSAVKFISNGTTAMKAFELMGKFDTRILPVLDGSNLMGSISASDLRLDLSLLEKPVFQYLEHLGRYRNPITIEKKDGVFELPKLISKLYKEGVHHIYYLSDHNVFRIISVSDILNAINKHPLNAYSQGLFNNVRYSKMFLP